MTWCDAISDALIAQASRVDLKNGAANLNSVATVAGALGGITACLGAACIELQGAGDDLDPNIYFGTYMGLIFLLLIASIFLNRELEPEIIKNPRMKAEHMQRYNEMRERQQLYGGVPDDGINSYQIPFESSHDSGSVDETLCHSCSRTFRAICNLFGYKEWYLPLLFFLVIGIFLPNFDDLHYIFLTSVCDVDKYQYDFLNALTFVTLVALAVLYNQCLTGVQAWILVLISLGLFLLMTALMLVNALRLNLEMGMSDAVFNIFIFLLGTNAISVLAILPTQVVLTALIPHNVEASTMALVSGIFIWAFEVGAKISSSVYCMIFEVDDDHMENYPHVLEAKLPMIVLMMILTLILPRNEQISQLAQHLRKQHLKKLESIRGIKYDSLRDDDEVGLMLDAEGGADDDYDEEYSFSKMVPRG